MDTIKKKMKQYNWKMKQFEVNYNSILYKAFTDEYSWDQLMQLTYRVGKIEDHEKIFIETAGEYWGRLGIEDYRLGKFLI